MTKPTKKLLICESDIEQVKMLAHSAEKASSEGLETYKLLQDLIEAISSDRDGILDTVAEIQKLIWQTRVLSSNASVEAARAGESGRVFSVLAKEMSLLADKIKMNMNRIDVYSNNIVSRVDKCSSVAEETSEKIEIIEMSTQLVNQFMSDVDLESTRD